MKLGVGRAAFAAAAFGLFAGVAASPAAADTASEIRALKARLNKLESEEAAAKRAAKAEAQRAHAAPAVAHAPEAPKHWYEKLSIRGYTQMRYNDTINADNWNNVYSPHDRSVGPRRNFLLRRARLIVSGDVSSHLYLYVQFDLASAPSGTFSNSFTAGTNPSYALYNPQIGIYGNSAGNFAQMRDAYADISIDEKKEFRFRVGQSKIPYGFENMQSSQNRLALDRADAINSCCKDERDLGIFFYYTPEHMRHLFRDLVRNNLKGTGDYGMVALGVYNGQGANRIELNNGVHIVGRFTYPYVFANGQIVEASIQGYTGRYMPTTSAITPSLGMATNWAGYRPVGFPGAGVPFVNAPGYFDGTRNLVLGNYPGANAWGWSCVNGCQGVKDDRVAVTGVIYPQPFGLRAEWNWGRGPALDPTQTYIRSAGLNGGYVEATYKYDDKEFGLGTFFPFFKWQYFNGGWKTETNAPSARTYEWDVGVEWQPLPEVEVTAVYSNMNRTNTGAAPYRQFHADLLRMQLQWNY
ncbi:porin [Methylocystis iwaonis]|uniref:Porin n=1 Tax=Methylocystis iwaonis TaxID=2885079 RepID=A0ABM8EAY8_9HYPH|nr:porin [Methylocystis iwaonis]BDV35114.1 porin [Methylocystis iwaonis]